MLTGGEASQGQHPGADPNPCQRPIRPGLPEPTSQSSDVGEPVNTESDDVAASDDGAASGACLLSDGEVGDAIGTSVDGTEFINDDFLLSCQYAATVQSGVNLTVIIPSDPSDADFIFDEVRDGEAVSGLGDEAYWHAEPRNALSVLVGDEIVGVQFYGLGAAGSREVAIALAEKAIKTR